MADMPLARHNRRRVAARASEKKMNYWKILFVILLCVPVIYVAIRFVIKLYRTFRANKERINM
jgi:uncharacterized protein YpmS